MSLEQTPPPLKSGLPFSLKNKRIWVAGHGGMVGSALIRRLGQEACEILTAPRQDVDLRRQTDVERWIERNRPDVVLLAAAKVGGIVANDRFPAEFLYDNLAIEMNVVQAAHRIGVEKLVLLGSTCVYPKLAPQPISEDALMTGPLEPTNEWYAIAKIAGIKLCQSYRRQYGADFISAQPTSLYGPGDNFDLETGHVLPALIRKAHEAKSVCAPELVVWGSGSPLREFLHVDDLADAIVFLTKAYSGPRPVNVGSGEEISIRDLAALVCDIVGFGGKLVFDGSRPDGTPRKFTDTSTLAAMGWRARIALRDGVARLYRDLRGHHPIFTIDDAAKPAA